MNEGSALVGAEVVDGNRRLPGGVAVLIRGGQIIAVCPQADLPAGVRRVDLAGRVLTPGFVDIHIHGAAGDSFADGGDAVVRLLGHLADTGVTSVVASLVSAPISRMLAQAKALGDSSPAPRAAELLGVHFEGPFISPDQRGAHDLGSIASPSAEDIAAICAYAPDPVRMVTLAPERPGVLDLARALARRGAVVAVGHSSARPADFEAAVTAGARHVTHLWSAMSGVHLVDGLREPGLLEAALASTGLTAEVIADGRHLPAASLEIAQRCLSGRLAVVSDATRAAGLPEETRFMLGNTSCVVRDGVGRVIGSDSLAGSTTLLPQMLPHLVTRCGWPLEVAISAMTRVPARVVGEGHRKGMIAPGFDADLAVFDDELTCSAVLLRGQWLRRP